MKKLNKNWEIDNSYLKLPSKLYSKQLPETVNNPERIYFNYNLAKEIGLDSLSKSEILDYFSGNRLPKESNPIAQAYAGHQFGRFTMLGDGRAVLLCEHICPKGTRYDIQLKGSGRTPFSRQGDGRATLSSMLREYIISEAMYYLQIPTTRSLSVIKTGDKVYRDRAYSGGILTRVSSSHIRFGTFEFVNRFCSKDDLSIFINYTINRHYNQIKDTANPVLELFELVMIKQINLIVHWMRVGFIHGVMNTDNMSIAGETIDYGPCAFMNIYDPKTVFSSIDRNGRYSFGNQPNILYWNLAVFANSLVPLISNDKKKSIELIKDKLDDFSTIFHNSWYNMMYKKLGILEPIKNDKKLVDSLLELMISCKADYTNTFAALTLNNKSDDSLFESAKFKNWMEEWHHRIDYSKNSSSCISLMKTQNPLVIPRNHLIELALEQSENANFTGLDNLLKLISVPYNYASNFKFQTTPKGFDESYQTFCGT